MCAGGGFDPFSANVLFCLNISAGVAGVSPVSTVAYFFFQARCAAQEAARHKEKFPERKRWYSIFNSYISSLAWFDWQMCCIKGERSLFKHNTVLAFYLVTLFQV